MSKPTGTTHAARASADELKGYEDLLDAGKFEEAEAYAEILVKKVQMRVICGSNSMHSIKAIDVFHKNTKRKGGGPSKGAGMLAASFVRHDPKNGKLKMEAPNA